MQSRRGGDVGEGRKQATEVRLRRGAVLVLLAACGFAAILASASASPPTAVTEAATAVSEEEATLKGSVNPEGAETVYWFEYGKTESYGTKVPITPESVGSGSANVYVSQTVTGLEPSTDYHFRIVAESGKEAVPGEDEAFTTKGFEFSFGESGSGEGQLSEPYDVAVDSKGNAWVTDTGNSRVEKFDSEGKYLAQCGKAGSGNGEFKEPKGIAIDQNGHIWVVDSGNNRVQEFDAECKYVSQFGKEGSEVGQFKSPTGIMILGVGPIFVADTGNNRVQKFNSSGKWLATIGEAGSSDGQLKAPKGVASLGAGIRVADTGNNRIEKFNVTTFNYVSKFGTEGVGQGQFKSPTTIIVDFQERLWVVDSGNNRAQKFDKEGNWLDEIGEEGSGPGQFNEPIGIAEAAPQKLFIVDSGNDRVERWAVPAEPPDVVKRPATEITATTAILNANIDPEALATTYCFEYGPTTGYGTKVPLTAESIGSESEPVKVKQIATKLSPGTTYHYRAVAESSAGRTEGEDTKFKLTAPTVTTEPATEVKATQATLNGKVNPNSSLTDYWFEYGTEKEVFKVKIPLTPESIGSGSSGISVKQTATGLSKSTGYFFRLVALNEGGTTFGKEKEFTTEP
jgi:streptogramin lyase